MANLRQIVLVVVVAAVVMAARATDYVVDIGGVTSTEPDFPGDVELGMSEPDGHGLVEDVLDIDMEDEMMEDAKSSRRHLYRTRYISYAVLRRNAIPCGRRGHTYYDCSRRRRANPYRRGCSRITYCARNSK